MYKQFLTLLIFGMMLLSGCTMNTVPGIPLCSDKYSAAPYSLELLDKRYNCKD